MNHFKEVSNTEVALNMGSVDNHGSSSNLPLTKLTPDTPSDVTLPAALPPSPAQAMNKHRYYEPTEYEQILLAAGWVTMEDLDPDYLDYKRKYDGHPAEILDYANWTVTKHELDALFLRWETEFSPLLTPEAPYMGWQQRKQLDQIMRDTAYLEILLGY